VLAEYLPTLLFLIVAGGIGVALLVVGRVLGPQRPTVEKLSPYECGFGAFEDARMQFDVRYYLIAILLVGVHAEQVVLLVAGGDPTELAGRLASSLSAAVEAPVTVGASGPAAGPSSIATAFDEARRCVRSLLALGRAGHGAALADLGFVGQLIGDRTDLGGYVRATLGPVLDYDERRGTDLVATLRAYFECGTNLTRAKDLLHVHVNTVVQRLDRIGSLLGEGWQAPDRALEIQIALRLHQLHG
jgi:DNA-binding PucR family transcriptional regulator